MSINKCLASYYNQQYTFITDSSTDAYWTSSVTNRDEFTLISLSICWILQIRRYHSENFIQKSHCCEILSSRFIKLSISFTRFARSCISYRIRISFDRVNKSNQIEIESIEFSTSKNVWKATRETTSSKDTLKIIFSIVFNVWTRITITLQTAYNDWIILECVNIIFSCRIRH